MSQTRSAFKASEAWTDPFEVPVPLPHQTDAMPGYVKLAGETGTYVQFTGLGSKSLKNVFFFPHSNLETEKLCGE